MSFFDGGELLIVKTYGDITKDELVSFNKDIYSGLKTIYPKLIIADHRDANILFSDEDLKEVIQVRLKFPGQKEVTLIFLVSGITDTTYAYLTNNVHLDNAINNRIFNTIKGCAEYLNFKFTYEQLLHMIENLKYEYNH